MKKADVNGENELPLYTFLKSQKGFEGFKSHGVKGFVAKGVLERVVAKSDPNWEKPRAQSRERVFQQYLRPEGAQQR